MRRYPLPWQDLNTPSATQALRCLAAAVLLAAASVLGLHPTLAAFAGMALIVWVLVLVWGPFD